MSNRWTMEDVQKLQLKVSNSKGLKTYNSRVSTPQQQAYALGRLKAGKMNKTETAYAKRLEVLKQLGEILWYEFEPMNLRLADKCFYAVDFLVMLANGQLECHEIKGYWTDDALVKIKTAAEKFPFKFVAYKLVKGNWEEREF